MNNPCFALHARIHLVRLLYAAGVLCCLGVISPGAALAKQPAQSPANAITQIRISRIQDAECETAPITFGQPFIKGDLPRGKTLQARYNGEPLPTQVNIKARNDDGSARHAIITLRAPCDTGDSGIPVALTVVDKNKNHEIAPVTLEDVLATKFDTTITLNIDGKRWHLQARRLLERIAANGCDTATIFCKSWLKGPLASEWVVGAPLKGPNGKAHPHLAAYFAVRAFGPAPIERIRVDVVVENTWAYVKNPRNYHYRPTIRVADRAQPVYHPEAFTHYRQARWHHVVWWGKSRERPLYARLDSSYLQATPAVPNYAHGQLDPELAQSVRQSCPPMHHCGQTATMTNTGAQAAIGPLPRWTAAYIINPSYPMYRWMLANSDALGAYGFHFRERDTGRPLSIRNHPCATLIPAARMARCPVPPHGDDRFPQCQNHCKSPLIYNISHHPAPAYVAYLVTGNWYYLSEMTFMAGWMLFWQHPRYRGFAKGYVHQGSLRGQAWSLRTLGYTAYILPDESPKKAYFNQVVATNIAWYIEHFVENPRANDLGGIFMWHAVIYPHQDHERVGIAVWQQSFMTWAVGNLVDLGFAHAAKFRDWISQFQVGLMTAPGYCYPLASKYSIRVRDTRHSPFYNSFETIYDKTFPDQITNVGCDLKKLKKRLKTRHMSFDFPPGTMIGNPKSPTGYPANFQIGLAAAANADIPNAVKAWNIFATRPVQPDYSRSPQFAIVPTVNAPD